MDALIGVGGSGISDNFSSVVANTTNRAAFINNMILYCLDYNFDGVVLDWEPITEDTDKENYTLLIQELKTAMVVHELSLSVAVLALGSEFHPTVVHGWPPRLAVPLPYNHRPATNPYSCRKSAFRETFGGGESKEKACSRWREYPANTDFWSPSEAFPVEPLIPESIWRTWRDVGLDTPPRPSFGERTMGLDGLGSASRNELP